MASHNARYLVKAVFVITGRGLVLAGPILEGTVLTGDFIEFEALGQLRRREIKGVTMFRNPSIKDADIGLLIACQNQEEIDELRHQWNPVDVLAFIYRPES